METIKAIKIADEIITLYKMYGGADYIGEPVSQIEHMCQCAQLAEMENHDIEVILAAFFHDIGHLCEHVIEVNKMNGYGIADHEKIGAEFLKNKGFSEKIARLVSSHVAAKRYLTFKNPDYYKKLSNASKQTLALQGGPMNEEEASDFEKDPFFSLYINLRSWDDKAKAQNNPLPDLQLYRKMIIQHLTQLKN